MSLLQSLFLCCGWMVLVCPPSVCLVQTCRVLTEVTNVYMVVLFTAYIIGSKTSLLVLLTIVLYTCSDQLPELTSPSLLLSDTYLEEESFILTTNLSIP